MLNKITDNVEIHQTLPDIPNLTTQELKKEWDRGAKILKEAFNNLIDELNNNMFPVGYRMFVNNDKDYSNHLGFTWQKVAKGRVLVGKDENDTDFNTVGKIGGEKTHTLTVPEMAPHDHYQYFGTELMVDAGGLGVETVGNSVSFAGAISGKALMTSIAGEGTPHNNLQPYEVVNIWERIL